LKPFTGALLRVEGGRRRRQLNHSSPGRAVRGQEEEPELPDEEPPEDEPDDPLEDVPDPADDAPPPALFSFAPDDFVSDDDVEEDD
jgi:hypothetical protein